MSTTLRINHAECMIHNNILCNIIITVLVDDEVPACHCYPAMGQCCRATDKYHWNFETFLWPKKSLLLTGLLRACIQSRRGDTSQSADAILRRLYMYTVYYIRFSVVYVEASNHTFGNRGPDCFTYARHPLKWGRTQSVLKIE